MVAQTVISTAVYVFPEIYNSFRHWNAVLFLPMLHGSVNIFKYDKSTIFIYQRFP